MYMVCDATDLYYLAACSIHHLPDVRMNTVEVCNANERARGFEVKHHMYIEFAQ